MKFRTYHEVSGGDRSDLAGQVGDQRERVAQRLASIQRIIAVMSGKGGVGKSLVAAACARELAAHGATVGLLDADLSGPTTAAMLNARGPLEVTEDGVRPATGLDGVRLFSMDLLLEEGAPVRWKEPSSERFVWRSALEAGTLREFLADVLWGELDFLIVDLPPGSSRLADLEELAPGRAEVLVVTIPSAESRRAVSRAIRAAREHDTRVLGIIENMSGLVCPGCGETAAVFPGDAAERLAAEFGLPILVRLPFVPGADPAALPIHPVAEHLLGSQS